MTNKKILKIPYSAICLALALVLPMLTAQIPRIGGMLCPMHIPVLLCGFICGWQYGLIVGFIAPLLRFLIFGMPVIFPSGIGMAFELAAYGTIAGLMYKFLPKKVINIYVSLFVAMIGGRIIWGIVRTALAGLSGTDFPMAYFISAGFTNAVPGIALQILLIPALVVALDKAHLIPGGEKS